VYKPLNSAFDSFVKELLVVCR